MALPAIIAPSVLAADLSRLADECKEIVELGADWLHLDVMDGHFVPNLSFGAPVISSLHSHSHAFFDCHLMVANPEKWVGDFAKVGATQFTFHLEATEDPIALAQTIKEHKMLAGISIKPKTDVEQLIPVLRSGLFHTALVMTVEPGFGGQKFMADMMPKIARLRAEFPSLNIEVDGGLAPGESVTLCAKNGANVIVAGTSVFCAPDRKAAMDKMRQSVVESQQQQQ